MSSVVANIDLSSESLKSITSDASHMQYIPCHIEFDGEANLNKYFTPFVQKKLDESHEKCLTSSFRGYPLCGKQMKVPDNFVGVVMKESKSVEPENANVSNGEASDVVEPTIKNLKGVCAFDQFTYWNWDRQPGHADKYQQALDWLELSLEVS
ncbi:hypothetical protein HAZT_HAZT003921 [Hyalella azteca]|uniref:Uncharacterized protein n=1 Tax=Hyalella azteca TaxID=294128 RepID=A0A6A0H882_HYAAZ|nr:hypothetical protein HAZT_HAZT003921 [Hyalella azteca]